MTLKGNGGVPAWPYGYYFGFSGGVLGASTAFMTPFSAAAPFLSTAEAAKSLPALRAGTLWRLRIRTTTGTVTVTTITFTLRVNGVNTAITCTIAAGVASGSDLVNTVVVAAGDLLSLGASGNTGTVPSNIQASLEHF